MAIPEYLYSPLKEKLADVKVEHDGKSDTSLLELITGSEGWYEKSEHAKKIQDNNKDLTDQRDKWEKEKKEKDDKIKTLETDVEKAKEDQLSAADKKEFLKIKEKGMTDEMTARFNKFENDNKELTGKLDKLTTDLETEKKATNEATLSSAKKELDNKAITTLAKYKIEGTKAEAALAIMHQKSMLGVVKEDNNGGYKDKIRIFKDGKELESNIDKMVESFAKDNEFLVSGTKSGGTGSEHKGSGASGGTEDKLTSAQLMKSETGGYDENKK